MKIVPAIAAAMGTLLFAYLFGSFVATSFDITQWDADGRLFVAFIGTIFAVGAFAAVMDY